MKIPVSNGVPTRSERREADSAMPLQHVRKGSTETTPPVGARSRKLEHILTQREQQELFDEVIKCQLDFVGLQLSPEPQRVEDILLRCRYDVECSD
ncbi:unnamed protein product [Soboliphyme baturini]|uniref:Uncharacterized protein n=1 Tax=Soboliphyme baturini TaxID=241478 RepID=A0A183IPV8_9BILA|nr:unnamed protein product [Soboliphyme baturini]